MIHKYSVGLDIGAKEIWASMCTIDDRQAVKVKSSRTVTNSKAGFKSLDSWIKLHHKDAAIPLSILMEATGVYHENVAMHLHDKGLRVSIVVPNKAKRYMQSLGLKSKNDSIDAAGLARMGAEQALEQWKPMDGFFFQLRNLTRQHQTLQEHKTMTGNQLHAEQAGSAPDKLIIKQMKAIIALLNKQIAEMNKAIKAHVASNKEIAEKINNICRIKGLAIHSVATVLAETNGFILFKTYKQVVSYAGYDVVENQSGKHMGKTKISKRGNAHIRRILFLPAFNTVRFGEPIMADLYNRTFERHKTKMKSYVAVQKKLLLMIYFMWKTDTPYDKMYQDRKAANIQEEEQSPSSGAPREAVKKVAPNKVEATQGRHPMNDHSTPPLGKAKVRKQKKLALA